MSNWEKNEEIQILQEYLRIPSVHPNVDYGEISKFSNDFFVTNRNILCRANCEVSQKTSKKSPVGL